MSDDRFLDELDKAVGKRVDGKSDKFRKAYTRSVQRDTYRGVFQEAEGFAGLNGFEGYLSEPGHAYDREGLRAMARRTMELAVRDNYLPGAVTAARIYDNLGKGDIGAAKLVDAVKKIKAKGEVQITDNNLTAVKYFLEHRHTGKDKQRTTSSSTDLSSRVTVFIVFTLAGLALSLTSLTLTGHAISGLTATTPGLLGILLFIVGLTGMFFRLRKN